MKRIKESGRDQGILFSTYYVGDRLPADHEVYLFNKLMDKLDIKPMLDSYSPEGGSMYSPKDHLAVILYAYFKGITSSNKISELTAVSLPFIFLSGGYHIKPRTIRRFRVKHKESLRKIFTSTITLASEVKLIDLTKVFAIDGSKFEANASFSKTLKEREWKERQKLILKKVDEFLDEWEANDNLEENLEEKRKEQFDKIKAKLDKLKDSSVSSESQAEQTKKEKISNTKKEAKAVTRKKSIKVNDLDKAQELLKQYEATDELLTNFESSKEDLNLNLTDADCRVMKSDSITKECYNIQAITNNQVLVAVDVTSDENDQAQLKPMIIDLKKNLNISRTEIQLLADAGYNKGENLKYIDEEEHIDAYISMYDRSKEKKEKPFLKENFVFDEDSESWACPDGKKLEFMKEHIQNGKKHALFGCKKEFCLFCPERQNCVVTKEDKKRGYRTIDDDGFTVFRQEMINKLSKDEGKATYKKRAPEVEPVFGQIKGNRGFRRFGLKGLVKVKTEFLIVSIAHNLSKILKQISRDFVLQDEYAI